MITHQLVRGSTTSARSGSAIIFALIAVVVLAVMGGAVMTLSATTNRAINHSREDLRAFYLAEAGISEGSTALAAAITAGRAPPVALGSEVAPLLLNGGMYWVVIEEDVAAKAFRITATAEVNRTRHALEAVAEKIEDTIYSHALFAGNISGDPSYVLGLAGLGTQADDVEGDVYSGGDVALTGASTVNGVVRATGSITGSPGDSGITQPIPDLVAMDYANNNDVDVKAAFDAGEVYTSNPLGGSAGQLPEADPAHIFRKNPSDRTTEITSTSKDDYFLEDPYESVRRDPAMDGSDACEISLSGSDGNPGVSGTDKIYYVDGNLWLHNRDTYSFKFSHEADEASVVTFVVKGNIYFSDNLFYQDDATDAVVFIAVKDPALPDSGNIYFGDPVFGTLKEMHAFMYAENDFYDVNLDATGSANVRVTGNMTAGNHVSIDRDYDTGSGIQHSQLIVDFDPRIVHKDVEPPGMPVTSGGESGLSIVSWREVAAR